LGEQSAALARDAQCIRMHPIFNFRLPVLCFLFIG